MEGLKLAERQEYNNKKIALLVGTDNNFKFVAGMIKRLEDKLVAIETLFGCC